MLSWGGPASAHRQPRRRPRGTCCLRSQRTTARGRSCGSPPPSRRCILSPSLRSLSAQRSRRCRPRAQRRPRVSRYVNDLCEADGQRSPIGVVALQSFMTYSILRYAGEPRIFPLVDGVGPDVAVRPRHPLAQLEVRALPVPALSTHTMRARDPLASAPAATTRTMPRRTWTVGRLSRW